ncbi:MAG: CDP-glycerol glycerophosphotransferase family protein [Alphaproteobacteria bacterium]|nr:CDP-glycerol glycerophosphotransferase family protein [Alphaproteobacteria bacterium]
MTRRVLFTGYAPVHFLCARPLYERLDEIASVDVYVSGGLRTKRNGDYAYDGPAMYEPLGVPTEQILPVSSLPGTPFDVVLSANKRLLTRREDVGCQIQIFHGVSFRNRGVREENLVYDRFFVVGPYMQRLFEDTGMLDRGDERAVPVGFPKTDPLVDDTLDRDALLARHGFDGSRPVILYAPTGGAHNSLETMGEAMLRVLSAADRYDILVKPHDHPKNASIDWFERLTRLRSRHLRVVHDMDVVPLLYLADLLITDASSVANEFALLDRPMIFLDVPRLLDEARAAGANLDLQTWGRRGGVLVESPDEIVSAVADSLADPERLSPMRRAIAEDVFFNPGCATETAMTWLRRHLDV